MTCKVGGEGSEWGKNHWDAHFGTCGRFLGDVEGPRKLSKVATGGVSA